MIFIALASGAMAVVLAKPSSSNGMNSSLAPETTPTASLYGVVNGLQAVAFFPMTPLPPYMVPTRTASNLQIEPDMSSDEILVTAENSLLEKEPTIYNACVDQPIVVRVRDDFNNTIKVGDTILHSNRSFRTEIELFNVSQSSSVVNDLYTHQNLLEENLAGLSKDELAHALLNSGLTHEDIHACFRGGLMISARSLRSMGIDLPGVASDEILTTMGFSIMHEDGSDYSDGLEELIAYIAPTIDPEVPSNYIPKGAARQIGSKYSPIPAYLAFLEETDPFLYGKILEAKKDGSIIALYDALYQAASRAIYERYRLHMSDQEADMEAKTKARTLTAQLITDFISIQGMDQVIARSIQFEKTLNEQGFTVQ